MQWRKYPLKVFVEITLYFENTDRFYNNCAYSIPHTILQIRRLNVHVHCY